MLTSYDSQGRVIRVESPEGIVSYAYDLFGRRTGVVEKFWVDEGTGPIEVTNSTTWTYDDLNRLIDEVFVTDADTLLAPQSLPAGTKAK